MQTFGKAMRNCLPAIGLGLAGALGLASVTVVTAPAAQAQQKAKKEFVENYNAATAALKAGKTQEAIDKANAAMPHASDTGQRSVLLQIIVSANCNAKKHAECVAAIGKAQANGGLNGEQQKNFDKILAGEYDAMNQPAKALEQTKKNIDKYGGDATEYAYVARKELDAKRYDEAIKYAQQAIQKSGKPVGTHYNILLNAYNAQGKMDEYYKTLERVAPMLKTDSYWRLLIEATKKQPKYKSTDALLDMYRTLEAAGVKLNDQEKREMADMALQRGMPIEAEKIWAPMFKAGTLGGASDKDADRNKRLYERAQAEAKEDKNGGLAQGEKDAATRATGDAYGKAAESYMGNGDYAKAVDLFQKGLAKGQLDAGQLDLIRLRLGIAQWKAGQKDAAKKTWGEIKSDNGGAWLAKSWLAISKS